MRIMVWLAAATLLSTPSAGAERLFKELVDDCVLVGVIRDDPTAGQNAADMARAMTCLHIVQGLITVMQLNCTSGLEGTARPLSQLSIATTNASQAADAIVAYSKKAPPDRMDESALPQAVVALSKERPCGK